MPLEVGPEAVRCGLDLAGSAEELLRSAPDAGSPEALAKLRQEAAALVQEAGE